MTLTIPLTDDQLTRLWLKASSHVHFPREDPRKAWTLREKKEVIRLYIQALADNTQ